jgi:3D (Asp-Asp-Asp) domain-containing protein
MSQPAAEAPAAGPARRALTMTATGYDPGPVSTGKRPGDAGYGVTASGRRAGYGVVAVDPRVIPLGTRLYVPGYGYAVAGDTGSAIKGYRIDLGFGSYAEAVRYGRQTVTVYLLE